jgi:hypothetical protein
MCDHNCTASSLNHEIWHGSSTESEDFSEIQLVSILTVTFIAVLFPGQDTNMFTVVLVHNGFFTGLRGTVKYIDATAYSFDNCSSDTWSLFWVDEILRMVGLSREGKLRCS